MRALRCSAAPSSWTLWSPDLSARPPAGDPSFFSEEMASTERPSSSSMTRDLLEMEQLVGEHILRNPLSAVTVLRLGFRLSEDTTLATYLSLPVVPTFAGFDPRLQFLHE